MSESRAEFVSAVHPARTQVRRMGQTLRHYWTDASGYQKFLYVVGTVLLVSAMFHLGMILVTGGPGKARSRGANLSRLASPSRSPAGRWDGS